MSLPSSLRESFSWRLALSFVGLGVGIALIIQLWRVDFDRRGFVPGADGVRLAFEIQGSGPPLIALAGGPGMSHHSFHPHLALLADRATVIYFDPRGRGRSDRAADYRVADDVRDLESLRRALGLADIALLGHSYGAHLAIAYTLEYLTYVRKLVLVSPIIGRSAWKAHLQTLTEAPGMSETLASLEQGHGEVRLSHRETRNQILRTLAPLYWCAPERFSASIFQSWHRISRQNFRVYEAIVGHPFGVLNGDLADSQIEERLSEIETPTLLVEGACDGVLPKGHVEWLERTLPRAQRLTLPPSGHSPFIEQPRSFADQVGRFLAEPVALSGEGILPLAAQESGSVSLQHPSSGPAVTRARDSQ